MVFNIFHVYNEVMPANSYVLGRSREHNLLSKLRMNGWFAIRGSGSKAGMVLVDGKKYFPIDIISVRKEKKNKNNFRISRCCFYG